MWVPVQVTRCKRGLDTVLEFNDETKIPPNSDKFWNSSESKGSLNRYLAQKIISYNNSLPLLVVTYYDTVLHFR